MYGKIAPVRLELGGEVNSNATGTPLCRTMCGENGNECVRMWMEREKVAAVSEGISGLCSILYTGASGNKCGLSLEQRRASFVGIKNR